jgi:hypothetical protein
MSSVLFAAGADALPAPLFPKVIKGGRAATAKARGRREIGEKRQAVELTWGERLGIHRALNMAAGESGFWGRAVRPNGEMR